MPARLRIGSGGDYNGRMSDHLLALLERVHVTLVETSLPENIGPAAAKANNGSR